MATALKLTDRIEDGTPQWQEAKSDIVHTFFGTLADNASENGDLNLYFDYYKAEIHGLSETVGLDSEERQSNGLPATYHSDLLEVVKLIQESDFTITKDDLRTKLKHSQQPTVKNEPYDRVIDIAVRLWLMMNTRDPAFELHGRGLGRPCLDWPDSQSFLDFVHGSFRDTRERLTARESRIKQGFMAAYMHNVCRLEIEWTPSLEDHLRLQRKRNRRILWVFRDEEFLKAHQNVSVFNSAPAHTAASNRVRRSSVSSSAIVPAGSIPSPSPAASFYSTTGVNAVAAQATSAALQQPTWTAGGQSNAASGSQPSPLPQTPAPSPPQTPNQNPSNTSTLAANTNQTNAAGVPIYVPPSKVSSPYPADLLRETIQTYNLLFPSWDEMTRVFLLSRKVNSFSPLGEDRDLDLRKYKYWQERLLELYEEVYLSPPTGFRQMWRDRRDPEKYSTFIIGIMLFILTVVSTVTGIIQTVTALMGVIGGSGSSGGSGPTNLTLVIGTQTFTAIQAT